MENQPSIQPIAPDRPPSICIAVDRTRAMVRGLWRVAFAALLFGPVLVMDLDWKLLWQTQRATFLASALLTALLAAAGLVLLVYGVRWIMLAAWPGRVGVDVSPLHISMRAGPFGQETYAWSEIRVAYDEDVDQALWNVLLDDETLPCVRHPACQEDLTVRIQRLAALDAAELAALLKPYFKRGLAESSEDDRTQSDA